MRAAAPSRISDVIFRSSLGILEGTKVSEGIYGMGEAEVRRAEGLWRYDVVIC